MRAAKVDMNHRVITNELRQMGFTVSSLARLGDGMPDIVVGWDGHNWLFEIKNPKSAKSDQRLTEAEVTWHETWRGQVAVVWSTKDCVMAMVSTGFPRHRLPSLALRLLSPLLPG